MWSEAAEALGRRYHAMYGFMQGVWVSMLVLVDGAAGHPGLGIVGALRARGRFVAVLAALLAEVSRRVRG